MSSQQDPLTVNDSVSPPKTSFKWNQSDGIQKISATLDENYELFDRVDLSGLVCDLEGWIELMRHLPFGLKHLKLPFCSGIDHTGWQKLTTQLDLLGGLLTIDLSRNTIDGVPLTRLLRVLVLKKGQAGNRMSIILDGCSLDELGYFSSACFSHYFKHISVDGASVDGSPIECFDPKASIRLNNFQRLVSAGGKRLSSLSAPTASFSGRSSLKKSVTWNSDLHEFRRLNDDIDEFDESDKEKETKDSCSSSSTGFQLDERLTEEEDATTEEEEGEETLPSTANTWEVEDIVAKKTMAGELYYQVKWKGRDSTFNTWESRSSLQAEQMALLVALETQNGREMTTLSSSPSIASSSSGLATDERENTNRAEDNRVSFPAWESSSEFTLAAFNLRWRNSYINLDLRGCVVSGEEEFIGLCNLLKGSIGLCELRMCSLKNVSVLPNDCMDALCGLISHFLHLEIVDLTNCRIGPAGAVKLRQVLPAQLKSLILSCNDIGDSGCISLSQQLSCIQTLTELDLSRNDIGAEGCDALSTEFGKMPGLQNLDLGSNKLSNSSCASLCNILSAKNTNLRRLLLNSNPLITNGEPFKALGTMRQLIRLDIRGPVLSATNLVPFKKFEAGVLVYTTREQVPKKRKKHTIATKAERRERRIEGSVFNQIRVQREAKRRRSQEPA